MKTLLKILGYFIASIPIMLAFGALWLAHGFKTMLCGVAAFLLCLGCVFLGVKLICDYD